LRIPPFKLEEILLALKRLLKEVKDFRGKLVLVESTKSKIIEGSFKTKSF
jgi:hypothetical protein